MDNKNFLNFVQSQYLRAVREFYQSQVDEIDFGASGSGNIRRKINRYSF